MFSADHLMPGRVTVPRRGGKVISTPPEDEPKDFQHSKRELSFSPNWSLNTANVIRVTRVQQWTGNCERPVDVIELSHH